MLGQGHWKQIFIYLSTAVCEQQHHRLDLFCHCKVGDLFLVAIRHDVAN